MRLPIVMSIANRAMGAPLSIWNDQQDSIALRDSGWLQFYAEDNQEATDLHFLAYKVAEDPSVQLPAFVCFDGFILSHTYEPIDMLTQEQVDTYLPKLSPAEKLDAKDPISFGMYATPEYYLEFRYEMDQAQKRAKDAIAKYGKEFGTMFGRDYSALVEGYHLDDAETAIVAMGSICGTVKDAIDEMRAAGKKVGLLKIRIFRPFPSEEIAKALSKVERVAVLDKNISLGARGGATVLEVRDAMYGSAIPVKGYVLGLGGRDIRKKDIKEIVSLCGERDRRPVLWTEEGVDLKWPIRKRPVNCSTAATVPAGAVANALAARIVTNAAGPNTIVVSATGCMEVFSTPYPETAWKVPWIHSLFENASAVASGIDAALKKQGRTEKIVVMGGDGATFDIGMICLSGAFERGHDFAYICYDNEAYMNTGIQRSGATPYDASTTTSPAGSQSFGNKRPKKDMPAILAAHGAPYVATASVAYPSDLMQKVEKAINTQGTLLCPGPCPRAVPGGALKGTRRLQLQNSQSRPASG